MNLSNEQKLKLAITSIAASLVATALLMAVLLWNTLDQRSKDHERDTLLIEACEFADGDHYHVDEAQVECVSDVAEALNKN